MNRLPFIHTVMEAARPLAAIEMGDPPPGETRTTEQAVADLVEETGASPSLVWECLAHLIEQDRIDRIWEARIDADMDRLRRP